MIGRGGMGVVYRARSPGGELVALKLLRKATLAEARARFERERRLLASLGETEGFVPLLDAGESTEGPFIVMKLVTGGTLRARLQRGPLGVDETVALGIALGSALGAAHARGIIHRDLKPENVLFDGTMPLVADLGLAKHFAGDAPGASQSVSLSQTGTSRGTAGYLAPEQLKDAKSAGPAADVFALGALLYECLSGRPSFSGESLIEILVAIEECDPEPLGVLRPDAPRALVALVERALAREPARRPADGHAIARELDALDAPPPRRRRGTVLVLVAALALGAAVAVHERPGREPGPKPPPRPVAPEPDLAPAHAARGWVLLRRKELDAALAELENALALDRKNAVALAGRARVRQARGDLGAEGDAEEALRVDPGLGAAWAVLGHARLRRGEVESAIAALTSAVALEPRDLEAWYDQAEALSRAERFEDALVPAGRAIELDPDLARARYVRAVARLRLGDLAGAEEDAARAAEIDPKLRPPLLVLGNARVYLKDIEGAVAAYTRAIELAPESADGWSGRGWAHQKRGEWTESIADLSHAIELDAKDADAWGYRAWANVSVSNAKAAAADATKAIELDPKFAEFWGTRAIARSMLRKYDDAAADADRAIALAPGVARFRGYRSMARCAKGDYQGALEDAEKEIELEPRISTGYTDRGRAYAGLGRKAEAVRDFETYLELDPEAVDARSVRAEIARLRGSP